MKLIISLALFFQLNLFAGVKLYHHSTSKNVSIILEQLEYYFGITEELVQTLPIQTSCLKVKPTKHELELCLDAKGTVFVVQENLPRLNHKYRIFRKIDELFN